MSDEAVWQDAKLATPKYEPDRWSAPVVCLTNLGNLYMLSYGGVWQRPHDFLPGEQVDWWIEDPNNQR